MNSIRKQAAVAIAGLMLATSLILGSLTYFSAQRALTETLATVLESKAEDAARYMAARITALVEKTQSIARNYAIQSNKLAYLEASLEEFTALGVLDSAGNLHLHNGQVIDAREEPYFQALLTGPRRNGSH